MDDMVCIFTERNVVVTHTFHAPDHQSPELRKHPREFEVLHHPVYMVQVFIHILQEKNRAVGIRLERRSRKAV